MGRDTGHRRQEPRMRVERLLGVRLFECNLGILTLTDSGQIVISCAERSPR